MASFLLLLLPAELQNAIYASLGVNDIKNLRVTCSALAKALPLHFDRVFISANSLNIEVFNAIANHETFRHQVTEIIWDDARFRTEPKLGEEEQDYWGYETDTEYECTRWFRRGRFDYGDQGTYIYPGVHMGITESWEHYQALMDDQTQVLSCNADIEAFNHGLRRFTSLKRVTITPSAHGRHWSPLYRTPMIRAFPVGFDYPLPRTWQFYDDDEPFDALPWVSHGDETPHLDICGVESTAEAYRDQWRGFRLVTRALSEYADHTISEFVIGGTEVQSGLNCRIFDQWSPEYGDLVTLLKRPGFRHLELHLFTAFLEDDDWHSLKTGLLRDAFAQAKDLEYLCLRTTTDISDVVPQCLIPGIEGHAVPLRGIFLPESWSRLQHFVITNLLVELDDFMSLLASLSPSLRSVKIIDMAFESQEHGYDDLLRAIRDDLDWRLRPVGKRPKVQIAAKRLDDDEIEEGRYIIFGQPISSYLYGTGKNPFEDSKYRIRQGRGAVQRDIFDPSFEEPF
ncbi:hypothetical protein QX201_010349 [Fusarium graminearum]